MTIEQFIELLTEDTQLIRVYDMTNDKVAFEGHANMVARCYEELLDVEVLSIDSLYEETNIFTLNIEQ